MIRRLIYPAVWSGLFHERIARVAMAASVAALVASACAPVLAAPPHLIAAWPVAGASLSVARHTFDLTFNRPLDGGASSATVWRELDGAPVPSDASLDAANPHRLTVQLREPTAGAYQLLWHAVAAGTREVADGEQSFTLQDESGAPPRVGVSPPNADSGEKLELTGDGVAPTTEVH